MNIRTIEISGFAAAFQALRLPHNGEAKSHIITHINFDDIALPPADSEHSARTPLPTGEGRGGALSYRTYIEVHPKDILLMRLLQHSGDQHAKVLRGILAYVEIEAPIYWWIDLETYTVGHQRLCSASTMHTECKGLYGEQLQQVKGSIPMSRMVKKIDYFSYQTLRRIAFQRHNHRLPEFHQFIDWMHTLPYADELIFDGLEGIDNGDPSLPKQ